MFLKNGEKGNRQINIPENEGMFFGSLQQEILKFDLNLVTKNGSDKNTSALQKA